MTGFNAGWLALRGAADARARDRGLMAELAAHFAGRRPPVILDLGAGIGATMAALAPHLPQGQLWRLVDDDAALLARADPPQGARAEGVAVDLSPGIAGLLDPRPDLLAASAFLDLASAPWLDAMAQTAADRQLPVYAALTYDGREHWSPPHRLDTPALIAFHADQARDKGLGGPALGPDAAPYLADRLARRGYRVLTRRSDWVLEQPRDARLIAALAEGSAAAIRPALGAQADHWLEARLLADRALIGHLDLLALPG